MSTERLNEEKPAKPPIPIWAWCFAVACIMVMVLTRGGAIFGALGGGAAAACVGIARESSMNLALRIVICIAITMACWGVTFFIIGGLVLWQIGAGQ